jgi:polyisoprenoid-binding protein YceI
MGATRWRPHNTPDRVPAAGRWDIDPRYSTIRFDARHRDVGPVRGRFAGITGEVLVEPAAGAVSVAVLIDAGTVSTSMAHLDTRLRSAELLDVDRHRWIGFRGIALWFDDPCWRVAGNLTVRDTISMVVMRVAPTGVGLHPITGARYAGFTATTELDRFSVGLGWNRERPDERRRLSNTVQLRAGIVAVLVEPAATIDAVVDPAALGSAVRVQPPAQQSSPASSCRARVPVQPPIPAGGRHD